MKYIYGFLLLLFPYCCIAQSITGRVFDQKSKPIEFATIILKKDSAIINTYISDSNGAFQIKNLSYNVRYKLICSFVGYASKDTAFSFTKNVDIAVKLLPQKNQLKEVVVQERKKIIERKIDRIVFNVENNVNTIGFDALDLLSKTPMVRVDNDAISLIGKNEVAVMVDDKILHLSGDALSSLLKSMSAESISKIEVITNPPAQYEATGISGLINIVTKKIRTPGFYGMATYNLSRTSYNTEYGSVSFNYNIKQLLLFANFSGSNGAHAPLYSKNTDYDSQNWNRVSNTKEYTKFLRGAFGFELLMSKKTTIGASFNFSDSRPNLFSAGNTVIVNKSTKLIDSVLLSDDSYNKKFTDHSANLHISHKIDSMGKNLVFDADIFGTDFNNSGNLQNSNHFANGMLTPFSTTNYLSNYDQLSKGYSLNTVVSIPFKKSKLSFGGKLSMVKFNSDVSLYQILDNFPLLDTTNTNKFNYKENIQALFTNFNTSFGKWEVQAGVRGEFTETSGFSPTLNQLKKNSYFNLFPTFYITYQADPQNTLSFNYGRRIGRPRYSSLNPFRLYQGVYSYSLGNPDLKPSFSNNFELSHTYKNMFSTTLSYSRSNNMISGLSEVQNGSNKVITVIGNFLSTSNYVIDESLDLFILKWLESVNEVSYYYTATSSSIPATLASIKGSGGDIRSINSIFFNKSKTFTGGIDFTYSFPNVSGIESFRKYYYFDLSTGVLFLDKKLRLTFEARDIFKTKTIIYSSVINQVGILSSANNDSRRYVLNINYTFGNSKIKKGSAHAANGEEKGRSSNQ